MTGPIIRMYADLYLLSRKQSTKKNMKKVNNYQTPRSVCVPMEVSDLLCVSGFEDYDSLGEELGFSDLSEYMEW